MGIVLSKRLNSRLSKLPENLKRRVFEALELLDQNPKDVRLDVKLLKGKFAGKYRLRVGDFRIIYYVKEDDIVISSFGPRGGAYK